ncbi:MAG: hypothetical protein QGH25_12075 [Candidatus Latescibacteria bacterium]|jgi:hypothetical protein|nr:hypothetical protein [Candidatus Latescibacterota bacterium]
MMDSNTDQLRVSIDRCQKVLRFGTGTILAAFVLIIAATTVSTAEWVQVLCKALYYVIVLDALASVGIWYYRTRLEKSLVEADSRQ